MLSTARRILKTSLAMLALMSSACLVMAQETAAPTATEGEYQLVWADEFDVDGAPNPKNWIFETGFVRNNELQWYQPENARVEGGLLVITGRREKKANPNFKAGSVNWKESRANAEYTSASLKTRGLHEWTYGRFEMRARIDTRAGLWPAFWTVGDARGWPAGGEIDIMEYFKGVLLANVFWAKADGAPRINSRRKAVADFKDPEWAWKFHTYRMDWDRERIRIFVDGLELNSVDLNTTQNETADRANPMREPQHIIVNLAIGGNAGGDPSGTEFPSRFEVDYVRVFQKPEQALADEARQREIHP
jgi:beta-glucanase (GH16 family)